VPFVILFALPVLQYTASEYPFGFFKLVSTSTFLFLPRPLCINVVVQKIMRNYGEPYEKKLG
jgi:hypothetical protein